MKRVILLTILILLVSSGYSFAEVPCKINYQGRLIKNNVPVHRPEGVPMVFNVDGKQVYSGNVPVYNGLFRVVLDLEDKGIDWTAGETKYLEVIVDGEQLTPPEALYAYPYAINSHLLEGSTKGYFLNVSGGGQTKQGDLNIMGNVGIGTTEPSEKLEVEGNIQVSGTGMWHHDGTKVRDNVTAPTSWTDLDLGSYVGSNYAVVMLKVKSRNGDNGIAFRPNGDTDDYYIGSSRNAGTTQFDPDATGKSALIFIETDAAGVIEWKAYYAREVDIWLLGYIK